MMTSKLSGAFKEDPATREEFYKFIENLKRK
jgi:GTP cyclohydrolase I